MIPHFMKQSGVSIDDKLIDIALQDVCHSNNPKPCDKAAFEKLFEEAHDFAFS